MSLSCRKRFYKSGPRPLDPSVPVQVIPPACLTGGEFDWEHANENPDDDILGYRVIGIAPAA